jgi:MFS superfamily sulfate permease-like transporter
MVESAGGRSQLAQFAASAVALLALFLTRPLEFLPEAALAAIIFRIGFDLVDIRGMRRIFAARRSEFWIALITALTAVFFGASRTSCSRPCSRCSPIRARATGRTTR